jgi:hypothetical protein
MSSPATIYVSLSARGKERLKHILRDKTCVQYPEPTDVVRAASAVYDTKDGCVLQWSYVYEDENPSVIDVIREALCQMSDESYAWQYVKIGGDSDDDYDFSTHDVDRVAFDMSINVSVDIVPRPNADVTTKAPAESRCPFCGSRNCEFGSTDYGRAIIDGKDVPIVTQTAYCFDCDRPHTDVYVWHHAERS